MSELRYMNDDVVEKQRDGDSALKDSEPFKKQYAAVLVQLNEVNEQACGFHELIFSSYSFLFFN